MGLIVPARSREKRGPEVQESLAAKPSVRVNTRVSIEHVPWDVNRSSMGKKKKILWTTSLEMCWTSLVGGSE